MIPVWVSLPCKSCSEPSITDTIKAWFLASPSDVCISGAEFDRYVYLYAITENEYELEFDENELSPIDHALVIFYEPVQQEGELRIFGAVPFAKLGRKFFLQDLWKYQTTDFVPPYMFEKEAKEAELFYWNVSLGSSLEKAMEQVELSYADSLPKLQDAIAQRLKWYILCQYKGMVMPKCIFAREDKIAFMMIRILAYRMIELKSVFLEAVDFAGFLSLIQMEAENFLLRQRLQNFTTEESLRKLFKHNYAKKRIKAMTVAQVTPLDHKWFVAQFPNATYMPDTFLNVPIEDYPGILPKYKGGFVHVPMYWEAIANWLIHKNASDVQRSFVANAYPPDLPEEVDPRASDLTEVLGRNRWHDWERKLLVQLSDKLRQLKKFQMAQGRSLSTKLRIKLHSVDTSHGDPIVESMDMEDLGNLLPPCCQPKGRFPTNMQRVRLTQILWNGGFTFEGILNYMGHLNDKYPKNPPESLERRFRVEDAIKTYHADIHHCGNVISDTIKNIPDRIKCPFVLINQREKVADCKQMCRQVTGLMAYKYDPHEVIAFNIQRYKGNTAEHRSKRNKLDEYDCTKIKVPDFGDSVSDDDDEDGEDEDEIEEEIKTRGVQFF